MTSHITHSVRSEGQHETQRIVFGLLGHTRSAAQLSKPDIALFAHHAGQDLQLPVEIPPTQTALGITQIP